MSMAVQRTNDHFVIVRMDAGASLDRLIAAEQFADQHARPSSENFFRQDFEMTEDPKEKDTFGSSEADAPQTRRREDVQYTGAEFVNEHVALCVGKRFPLVLSGAKTILLCSRICTGFVAREE